MQHDISIVIATVCRNTLIRAIKSIYAQKFNGKIQILIGVDVDPFENELRLKSAITKGKPDNFDIVWMNIGYSTSRRHGGFHSCHFGGSLRTSLSFLANSRYVMYLDDDDWLAPEHCEKILEAVQNKAWAFSFSIYSDGNKETPICIDRIESVGVNKGLYASGGGFVRPSGLILDKNQTLHLLHLWSCSINPEGDGEDRLIFSHIKDMDHGCTDMATIYYTLDPKDIMHEIRMNYISQYGEKYIFEPKIGTIR